MNGRAKDITHLHNSSPSPFMRRGAPFMETPMITELTIKEIRIPQDASEELKIFVNEDDIPVTGKIILIWYEEGKGVGRIPPALFWGKDQSLGVYVQNKYGRAFKGWKPVREDGELRLYPHT